jgi:hypothetical protein
VVVLLLGLVGVEESMGREHQPGVLCRHGHVLLVVLCRGRNPTKDEGRAVLLGGKEELCSVLSSGLGLL